MRDGWLFPLAREVAARHDFALAIEPQLGEMAQLRFPEGTLAYLNEQAFDLNPGTSTFVASHLAMELQFLAAGGFPVPDFAQVRHDSEPTWRDHAMHVATRLGYPLVLRGSGWRGVGPYLVTDADTLCELTGQMFELAPVVVVQRPVWGLQLALVVYRGALAIAYAVHPWRVVGDGTRTIQALIEADAALLRERGRRLTLSVDDWRLDDFLEYGRRDRATVPAAGEMVQLALRAAPEHGGRVEALAQALDPGLEELAVAVAKASGLLFCTIDVIVDRHGPWILDVHPDPNLGAYMALGQAPRDRAASLVERLILDTREQARRTAAIRHP